jgi:sialate O-acetylesterase
MRLSASAFVVALCLSIANNRVKGLVEEAHVDGYRGGGGGAGTSSYSFAKSYGDHMVLQQAPATAVVWGFCTGCAPSYRLTQAIKLKLTPANGPSVAVPVSISAVTATKQHGGSTWRAVLPPTLAKRSADGTALPYTLNIGNDTSLHDVLFGEVWVCSGQSNMAFLLENAMNGTSLVQDANNHPELRFMTTKKTTATTPQLELLGVGQTWSVSSNLTVSDDGKHVKVAQPSAPRSARHARPDAGYSAGSKDDNWLWMSAVCYLYGLQIHTARKVPVGLMNTNWGGTMIEEWSPAEAGSMCNAPVQSHLFNAMVSPLLNHTIKGVVWYQGESNGGAPRLYGCQLPAMVSTWRARWHAGSGGETSELFPFGVVQLSAVIAADPIQPVPIQWYQTQQYGTLPNPKMPNTFMATTYDLGDATSPFGSVHTRWKSEVGERLALAGRKVAYGEAVYSGPTFTNVTAHSCDGGEYNITLGFRDTGASGLEMRSMNISSQHDQGNWTGSSAFEVCVASGGSKPSVQGSCKPGALPAGGDLTVKNVTISAAVTWCDATTDCGGFTAHASCNATSSDAVHQVYFKKAEDSTMPNIDLSWLYFAKPVPACSLFSRYEGWAAPVKVSLGAGGSSITLSGAGACPDAVRFAWRGYPCEHLGCGLYSKAEGLPPPLFFTNTVPSTRV